MVEGCEFNEIILDELLWDRIGFGIGDNKVCECLLREVILIFEKIDEICVLECMIV